MITAQQLTINTDINTILNTLSKASNIDIQLVLTKLYNSWEAIVKKWAIYGYLSTELQEELYNCIRTSILIPEGLERELDVAIAK
jgi:hypothetical protein